ncbi:MAG: hypothetical protein JSS09_09685, partial [Verrucomicrobia bacterium]|nr:hypothetical protein [Verrucomicrobiota bacterium]
NLTSTEDIPEAYNKLDKVDQEILLGSIFNQVIKDYRSLTSIEKKTIEMCTKIVSTMSYKDHPTWFKSSLIYQKLAKKDENLSGLQLIIAGLTFGISLVLENLTSSKSDELELVDVISAIDLIFEKPTATKHLDIKHLEAMPPEEKTELVASLQALIQTPISNTEDEDTVLKIIEYLIYLPSINRLEFVHAIQDLILPTENPLSNMVFPLIYSYRQLSISGIKDPELKFSLLLQYLIPNDLDFWLIQEILDIIFPLNTDFESEEILELLTIIKDLEQPFRIDIIKSLAEVPFETRLSLLNLIKSCLTKDGPNPLQILELFKSDPIRTMDSSKRSEVLFIYNAIPSKKRIRFTQLIQALPLKDLSAPDQISLLTVLSAHNTSIEQGAECYNPSYLEKTSTNSKRFAHQSKYLQRSKEIITTCIKLIKHFPNMEKKSLFFLIISYLSKERNLLALELEPSNSQIFGVRRGLNNYLFTPMKTDYKECSDVIVSWMGSNLKEMVDLSSPENFKIKKAKYEIQDTYLGRRSFLKFEIFALSDYKRLFPHVRHKLHQVNSSEHPETDDNIPSSERYWNNPQKKQTEQTVGENYNLISKNIPQQTILNQKDFLISRFLMFLKTPQLPEKGSKSLIIKASNFIEMDQQVIIPLSKYYTLLPISTDWLEGNYPSWDPIDLMTKLGTFLVHQNPSFIEETLENIAKVFKDIMEWDGNDLNYLQEQMALLTYLSAHNTRDQRGSAAETEWLTLAIYGALGVTVTIDPNKLQDLEAFANPLLSDFVRSYKEMVKLSTEPSS